MRRIRIHVHRPRPNAVPIAVASRPIRACGHSRHVGTCPHCQQAQLARWAAQDRDVAR
jgi:hypothetical protein